MSDREKTRQQHRSFVSKVQSELHGSTTAVALFLKPDKVARVLMDEQDNLNELFYSLAVDPEFYALFKLTTLLTPNKEGDKIDEEYVSKYNLGSPEDESNEVDS